MKLKIINYLKILPIVVFMLFAIDDTSLLIAGSLKWFVNIFFITGVIMLWVTICDLIDELKEDFLNVRKNK